MPGPEKRLSSHSPSREYLLASSPNSMVKVAAAGAGVAIVASGATLGATDGEAVTRAGATLALVTPAERENRCAEKHDFGS